MKALNTLIKLKRKELDEMRSSIAALLEQQEAFSKARNIIESDLIRESEFLEKNPELNFAFSPFYTKCKFAIENLQLKIDALEQQIVQIQELVIDLFSELKRFEIVKENRIKRAKEQEKLVETKFFDEIGINSYTRNQQDF